MLANAPHFQTSIADLELEIKVRERMAKESFELRMSAIHNDDKVQAQLRDIREAHRALCILLGVWDLQANRRKEVR